ncbi:MAG: guanylate kinase [Oscillospiraceae bacterium]|nr:guanylate kinase [Oscillospiraceae bacterium]
MNERGRLIVISAPSGAGKGTVIERLLKLRPEIVMSVSATTRAPREGEKDGEAYHFIDTEKFLRMIRGGDFLEYAEYVGDYYGTPKKPVLDAIDAGKDVLLEIEVQGARQVIDIMPGAMTIFIVPPSMEELERRLRGRGTDSEDKLAARLLQAKTELGHKSEYTNIVVNDDIERAVTEIIEILDNT